MTILHRGNAYAEALSRRALFLACEIGLAAVVVSTVLAWFASQVNAADIGPSELTIKAPGAAAISTIGPPPALPSNIAPPGVQHAFQPFAGNTVPRNAPVVQLAQPIGAGVGVARAVRQSNQEPLPPGSQDEYLRGTGVPPIGSLTINTLPNIAGRTPAMVDRIPSMETQLGSHEYHRDWLNYSYRWDAPGFYNKPLYFEQVNLERYGYNWGAFQPFVSGAQFFVKVPLLPYMMTVHPPCEHVYALGYYRPGSCAPYQINWPEVRLDAAIVEGAFITGLVFLIP